MDRDIGTSPYMPARSSLPTLWVMLPPRTPQALGKRRAPECATLPTNTADACEHARSSQTTSKLGIQIASISVAE